MLKVCEWPGVGECTPIGVTFADLVAPSYFLLSEIFPLGPEVAKDQIKAMEDYAGNFLKIGSISLPLLVREFAQKFSYINI